MGCASAVDRVGGAQSGRGTKDRPHNEQTLPGREVATQRAWKMHFRLNKIIKVLKHRVCSLNVRGEGT